MLAIMTFFNNLSTRLGLLRIMALEASEEPSLLEELWEYYVEKYFTLHFEDYRYQNISVGQGGIVSLRGMVIAIFVGIILAAAASLFQKRTLGDLVRAIDREDANCAERAMTLEQLGLLRSTAIKQDLRRGTSLRRVVKCVEEERYIAEQRAKRAEFEAAEANAGKKWKDVPYRHDFFADHFYIPEDKLFGAHTQFDKKGSNPMTFVFTVVLCVIFMAVCCWLLPEMLQLVDNFIGVFQ